MSTTNEALKREKTNLVLNKSKSLLDGVIILLDLVQLVCQVFVFEIQLLDEDLRFINRIEGREFS